MEIPENLKHEYKICIEEQDTHGHVFRAQFVKRLIQRIAKNEFDLNNGEQMYIAMRNRSARTEEMLAASEAEVKRHKEARASTWKWIEGKYGKLHDWARKILPDPYRTQYFSCVANGSWDSIKDTGEPYTCVAGFRIVPTGYFHLETAQEQLLFDAFEAREHLEAEVKEVTKSRDMHALNAVNLFAEVGELRAEVKRLREQVEWKPITPDSLPKVGDEVACFSEGGCVIYEVAHHHCLFTSHKWREERAMTHYRPINPPAQPREDADNGTE